MNSQVVSGYEYVDVSVNVLINPAGYLSCMFLTGPEHSALKLLLIRGGTPVIYHNKAVLFLVKNLIT